MTDLIPLQRIGNADGTVALGPRHPRRAPRGGEWYIIKKDGSKEVHPSLAEANTALILEYPVSLIDAHISDIDQPEIVVYLEKVRDFLNTLTDPDTAPSPSRIAEQARELLL